MFETWKLMDFAPGEGRELGVFQPDFDDSGWMDVPVPGDVHRALIAAGRIPDPFYDQNEKEAAWMEEREWWYRCTFKATGGAPKEDERVLLTFHGLDTYAVLYLNGSLLGRSENMFHEAVFNVTNKLRWGQNNTLAVRFDPPLKRLNPENPFKSTWGRNPDRVFMRKAQFGYGWDWGPRLPTIGIWRPVELVRHRIGALLGTQFNTLRVDHKNNTALVMVRVEAMRFAGDTPLKAEIRLALPGEKKPVLFETLTLDQPGPLQDPVAYFTVKNPKLWWTNDLLGSDAEPALYDFRVTLRKGKDVLDVKEQKVGIRTLTLDQSPDPDEPGTRFFRFVLNGVPIFAKGANWIPADSFVGAIPPEHYERLLVMARDANMNMLRIWGGGIYEHDVFYELCDRLGILVWQDFMFACAMYPENDNRFINEVDAEARYQVRRLRSHPSLALWCGNNENQWLHERNNYDKPWEKVPGSLYYDVILPGAVKELDGVTPYWPGSPYGGSDYNSMEEGDRHNWWVWHGGPPRRFSEPVTADHSPEGVSYRHYAEDFGRFISEFGMHAAPVYETLRRVIPEDQRYHHSPSMDHHNKDNPKNKGDALMESVTGLPEDLETYIDFSMIAQAEGLKFGIEHFRRRKPHCSGALFWQLNDCWPVLSWSLIDYYGFGKAGYYYARRVFAPVLASFKEEADGGVSLWITNDLLDEFRDKVIVRLGRFDGDPVWEQALEVKAPENFSGEVRRWTREELTDPAGGDCNGLYLWVRSAANKFPENRHFFAAIKDLQREPVEPEMEIRQVGEGELEVELLAPANAYFVHLTHPDENTRYSDNYFDLEPGDRRVVRVTNPKAALNPAEIHLGWR
ncbi:MAG: glycoside hydrolase family 2 protein [Chloroflexi bacterium]|nr:glycoside hydrolase family 2 protein [Chloroflexota bacterium]